MASAQQPSVIKEIVIQGNARVSKEAILSAMRTKVGQPFVQDSLDRDKQSLTDMGFFSGVDVRGTPLGAGGSWQVTVNVAEWPEIKEFRVTGNTVVSTAEILKAIAPHMKPGDVFNLNARQQARNAIRSLYEKKSYFLAGITDFAPLPDSPSTINLAVLETTVGSVGIIGNKHTKEWVMRRLVKTRSGEAFNIQKWASDIRRLSNTRWFDSVVPLNPEEDLGKVNLTAEVKEAKTGMFNVGVQMDPQNTLAGLLRLSETNLQGTGQSVGLNLLQATGGGGLSADLDYTNPFYDSKDTSLRAAIYSKVNYHWAGSIFGSGSTPTSDNRYIERRTGVSLGFTRPINDDLSVGVSARYEGVRTEDFLITYYKDTYGNYIIDPNTGQKIEEPYIRQDGTLGIVSLGATLNRRDVDLDPSRGDWTQVSVEPGFSRITAAGPYGAAPGDYSFVRSVFEYRKYITDQKPRQRLDDPRRVLALRLKYGVISGTVPFFEQFFAGGVDTIRGYTDDRYWGTQTLLSTAEVRLPVQSSLSLIGFVDYGGAWGGFGSISDYTQSNKFKLHMGYGAGVSFKTPYGPIRLDLGFDENGKSRTHFMIGTTF